MTCISLIGFSAMAGIVGGVGFGDLTYFKGYNYGNYTLILSGVINTSYTHATNAIFW